MTEQILESRVRHEPTVNSFEGFFSASSGEVYRALFASLGDSDLASEATSEGFVRAFAKWDSVRSFKNPAGWVYRVGLNYATSRLRRRRFRDDRPVPEVPSFDPEPADPLLVNCVRKLNRRHLEVVVLRYFLDLDEASIAEALGVPVGTVRSRLARARKSLEASLIARGGES